MFLSEPNRAQDRSWTAQQSTRSTRTGLNAGTEWRTLCSRVWALAQVQPYVSGRGEHQLATPCRHHGWSPAQVLGAANQSGRHFSSRSVALALPSRNSEAQALYLASLYPGIPTLTWEGLLHPEMLGDFNWGGKAVEGCHTLMQQEQN